jgi:hypothetical protein
MSKLGIQYLNTNFKVISRIKEKEKAFVFHVQGRVIPSSALILAGSMDWLTTTIGLNYFGASEANPFISGIASQSLLAFTAVKLLTTLFVGLIFYQAERCLLKTEDKTSRSFKWTRLTLKMAYVGATAMLIVAVINNLSILIQAF